MSEHPIEGLMKTTMNSLKEMVDVNTIVGDPVQSPDGLVIIPVSKVCFGFASGGTQFNSLPKKDRKNEDDNQEKDYPFGGGSGAGVSVHPVAFIVAGNNQIKLLPVDQNSSALNSLFDFMTKLANNIEGMINKNKSNNNNTNNNEVNS